MTSTRTAPLRHVSAGPTGLTFLGVGWLSIAGLAAYLSVATPLVDRLVVASGGMADLERALAAVAFAVVPAGFGLAGALRLGAGIQMLRARRTSALRNAAATLTDVAVLGPVKLRDGRLIPEVALGRFGAVVMRELGGETRVRHSGGHWEIQLEGGWVPFEDPLERTARDAEALRRELDSGERDYVVRVHAALVTAAGDLARIPECAVLRPEQVAMFLTALPAQRTLTAARLDAVTKHLSAR